MQVRVLIAERERLVRGALRALLEREEDITVVAEAGRMQPDVVVMGDGVGATREILATGPSDVLVLMTETDGVFAALRAGARGVLLRDAEPAALVEAVRVVARGDVMLAPALATRLVADFLTRPERLHSTPQQLDELTAREREVVALVACGLTNEEIAERLVVTRATAKTHVSRALFKLRARDRAQLVVLAYECGLVRPGAQWADRRPRLRSVAA